MKGPEQTRKTRQSYDTLTDKLPGENSENILSSLFLLYRLYSLFLWREPKFLGGA
jgi:hypothetical protein